MPSRVRLVYTDVRFPYERVGVTRLSAVETFPFRTWLMKCKEAIWVDVQSVWPFQRRGPKVAAYNTHNIKESLAMWSSKCMTALLLIVAAQGAAAAQLPSAPSAVQQELQKPNTQAGGPPPTASQQPSTQQTEPASNGQEPALPIPKGSEPDESVATFRTHVDEVNLVFTVTDKRGRFVKDLVKDDLSILDDNKPPQAVVSFRRETDLPLRLGLLIDASNSVRDRFRFEQEAAVQFLNQNIRSSFDQAFVIGFDTTYEVTQDFTDDTEKLTKGVRMLKPGGGTTLYDAFFFACRDKLLKSQEGRPARRAFVVCWACSVTRR
jgi:Ca-activated chloride channel homolog